MAQHISIRVPWHDSGYKGCICENPLYNNACLRLKNISENRDDEFEDSKKGCSMKGHEEHLPCIAEGGCFMSNFGFERSVVHPYKASNPKTHGHFLETTQVYPPYSLPARPFRWMMRDCYDVFDGKMDVLEYFYGIDIKKENEPILKFNTMWIQDARNHKKIFDYFYRDVIPNESLCIAYSKQVPFVEDTRRVVMGIGHVSNIVPAVEHNHTDDGDLRSMTWETMIEHTIREDMENGVMMPYSEMMEYAEMHPDFDISSITIFASDDYHYEFSYATEHLSYDAVIDVLLQSTKSFEIIKECIDGPWDKVLKWLNDKFIEVWKDRGVYPGLGNLLVAAGFNYGNLMVGELKKYKDEDAFKMLEKSIDNPKKYYSAKIVESINPTIQKSWNNMAGNRKKLFKLLSRISLSIYQACVLFNEEKREKEGIILTDKEIIENPYILYEKTRACSVDELISLRKIEMAIYPPEFIRSEFPLNSPSALTSDIDERRIRAWLVHSLEYLADQGHTIYPKNLLINEVNSIIIKPECNVNGDVLASIEDYLEEEIVSKEASDKSRIYQLKRLADMDSVIQKSVLKRINSKKRHNVEEDWSQLVDKAFGATDDEVEFKARKEKVAVLKELSEARLSALVGGAGTGKTTLLSILCSSEKVRNGGVLLLAPTGKARVKMTQAMHDRGVDAEGKTIAQFLLRSKRYDYRSMRYKLSDKACKDVPDTVIIDEASMLTEEMFAALIQALKSSKRIIFVGDPNQLPPIGAGRPFVDLVKFLNKEIPEYLFPRVGKSYGELKIIRRQVSEDDSKRMDIELSKWFSEGNGTLDEDVFEHLQKSSDSRVEFRNWKTNDELENLMFDVLVEELDMKDMDDLDAFNRSLGANVTGKGSYFNMGCAKYAEDWQILAPIKNMPYGVRNLNQLIHRQYREDYLELAKRSWNRKISKALGSERIVYGDKVINVVNKKRDGYSRNSEIKVMNYIANGEIGIVAGGFGNSKTLRYTKVEFSSQPSVSYSFTSGDAGEDTEEVLELAYALTVHKAQGSEFKKVILVLNEPCNLISRELIYTALTRQTEKLIILYNEDAYKLRNYSTAFESDIARRFTNLFESPKIVEINDRYFEEYLIHKTVRGEMVRSKSEVIIANLLHSHEIEYEYEKEIWFDGIRKIPDFTIDDEESGECYYWEHCGMMSKDYYRKRWEEKKAFYLEHGIVEGENLIVTYDEPNGSIDTSKIEELINEFF